MRRVVLVMVVLAMTALMLGAAAAVGWVVAAANSAPDLKQLTPRTPHALSEIFASDGTPLGYIHSDIVFRNVPGSQIPNRMKQATVAIEDRRFFQHGALDYQGILRAGIRDVFGGSASLQGASTLTMQLVDNMYMPPQYAVRHDLKYKIVQAKLAEQLESNHTKNWVLNTYLNDAPYGTVDGETARGAGAASEIFFNKPVGKLNLAQMALLAGLPQAPSEYNPFLAPGLAKQRRNEVLQAMVASHYISQSLANAVARQPLQVQHNTSYNIRREPYVFDYVQQQLIDKYGLKAVEDGGLKVYTTIDLNLQQEARNAVLAHEGGAGNPAAALATVDPSNGHIVAMASTSDYSQTKFFYPTQGSRQPGSAFKVFALMTLIHDYHGDPGQTNYVSQYLPAGWLPSEPAWSVHTAEESYQGTINITKATIVSDNTVFAQLAVDLGMDKFDAMAHAMGITSPLQGNPAEVIGGVGNGVTPLEMADAYATLANGGSHVPATILDHVMFPNGRVDSLGNPPHTRVFSDGEAYAATSVLEGVIQSGTGTAAGYGCPAAGKTGTAENLANAWFVGYTPKLSTAVWVGYPEGNVPMGDGFGGTLAAPIWHDFMAQASNGYCGDFTQPNDPFYGGPFTGPHSAGNGPVFQNPNQNSNGTTTGPTYTSPYSNPTVYAQPAPSPARASRSGAGTSTGTGTTAGGHPGGAASGSGAIPGGWAAGGSANGGGNSGGTGGAGVKTH
ncbi:MAG: penicillin-binding protein [Solirubrobacterales bacterium]|nr:penicillin-binding protein [Solirubrobacterales bacterium]